MTPEIYERLQRALLYFETIRQKANELPAGYPIYRDAVDGASVLECALEDIDRECGHLAAEDRAEGEAMIRELEP